MTSPRDVLKLYKNLLKESKQLPVYNFRMYALRRIKSRFKEHKEEYDVHKINSLVKEGEKNLEIVKRQVIVNKLYSPEKLVIEK